MLIKVFFYNRAFNVVFKSSKNEKITLQHEFIFVFMACSGVLTLHNKCKPPKSVSPYPVLKVFNPPPVLKLFTFLLPPPPATGNGCFCIFHTWLLPKSTCSYF